MHKDEILNLLNTSDKREDKITALGEIITSLNPLNKTGDIEFIEQIIKCLDDQDDFVRIKATEVAEYYKEEIIVDKLLDKLINDTNYFVRGFSAKALGSIGNMKAREALEKASTDCEGFVVSFALQSLKTINIKLSFSSKLEMLKMKMKENVKKTD